MSAHPTGPWQRVGHRQIADANGNVIAEVWSGGCTSLEAADVAEYLIAAEPEQNELLATFTEWARQVAARDDVPRAIRSAAAGLHDDGKRMLAKATGATP